MKAHVDQDTCIGCGLCPSLCPALFEMQDDGKAHATADVVPAEAEDCAKDAVASCPVDAISVE